MNVFLGEDKEKKDFFGILVFTDFKKRRITGKNGFERTEKMSINERGIRKIKI